MNDSSPSRRRFTLGMTERTYAGPVPAADGQSATPGVWNAANAVTLLRLALVPVFLVLLFQDGGDSAGARIVAFAVFSVAMMTDRLDGELARRRGLVTDVGKIADPIADKVLTGAAFIGLSLLGELPWWVTIVVLVREWGITAMRFAVLKYGVLPANRGGKLKTALQALALGLYILPLPDAWEPIQAGAMALAVAVTIVTGVDYAMQAARLRRAGSADR
jgi:CDP-diacylglycerol--glycerol-3-phosphate 3-phosphatidyltransferase